MGREVEIGETELTAAEELGRVRRESDPRAASARYDREADCIVIDLIDGCTFAFPPQIAQDLQDATPDQLGEIEVSPAGFALHWPAIDVDFTVAGLIAGRFGTAAFTERQRRDVGSGLPAETAADTPQAKAGNRPRRTAPRRSR